MSAALRHRPPAAPGLAALLAAGALALTMAGNGASAAPQRPDARFNVKGLGAVGAGQLLTQAEAALGEPLAPEPAAPGRAAPVPAAASAAGVPGGCHHRQAAQQPGVRYTVAGGVVTRIETRARRWATLAGVHVGDSVEQARQLYGRRLQSAPHPYFDKGAVLSIYSADRRFALVMEADDAGRIVTLRSGRLPEVTWLEGCT